MHASYIQPSGVAQNMFFKFRQQFASHIDEIEEMLTNNRI
jgi:NADH:ubiquinone oxidoreductase subunit D